MSSTNTTPLRRINGRLQACDACRRRKVSCDHTRPVCLRCRKRKQERNCVYTVSATSVSGAAELPSSASASASASAPASPLAARIDAALDDIPAAADGQEGRRRSLVVSPGGRQPNPRSTTTGYLGYTSYCTVIVETLSILTDKSRIDSCTSSGDGPIDISPKTLEFGVAALRRIPLPEDGQTLFRPYATIHDTWIHMIAQRLLKSLYSNYAHYLGHDRTTAQLEEMTRKICLNTTKPILDHPDPDAWLAQFTGPNLRWESLGLLFMYWDLDRRPTKQRVLAPLSYGTEPSFDVLEIIILCVELSQEFSDGNLFLVYLKYKRTALESMLSGDASRQTWRYHADTVAALTFLGMHAQPENGSYRPTLYSEASRRVLMAVFGVDKVTVAFTGRPPLLTQKFVTTPLPLDLKDEYLFLDVDSLQKKAESTLDSKGWNTEGGLYSATCSRARATLAGIRERIAEAALGRESHASVDDLRKLKERQEVVVAEMPRSIHWHAECLTDPNGDWRHVFTRLLFQLERLLNEFFIERLLLRKGATDGGSLLAASFELVSLVLSLWTNMDKFIGVKKDFPWLLMGYGAPAGGILCKCLLKAESSELHPLYPHINRSSVIQKLSLLVAFLGWVSPTAPNADLCCECSVVIQRVLDQALNNPPGASTALGQMDWDFGDQVDFNFDLMDTFDWLRSDVPG